MQLEENLFTGHHEDYYWMVATREIRNRGDIVTAFFPNKYCHITSFDSGPISPGPDELSAGWESAHNIMVSPALTDQLDIPYDQYDEWYILETRDFPVKEPEVFVNYGGFTLIEIDTLNKNDDLRVQRRFQERPRLGGRTDVWRRAQSGRYERLHR